MTPRLQIGSGEGLAERPAVARGATFRSLLFPSGWTGASAFQRDPPAGFVDLNLDQVLAAIVSRRDEAVLRPIFHTSVRDEAVVRYRQAVFADLDQSEVQALFPPFCEAMARVRGSLALAAKGATSRPGQMARLKAICLYCDAIEQLRRGLSVQTLRSGGLLGLRTYLAHYTEAAPFRALVRPARELQALLSKARYGLLFRGDRLTVRRAAGEADYAATIRERFARFRPASAAAQRPPVDTVEGPLNHIEIAILGFASRLFPDEFRQLAIYLERQTDFVDEVIAALDREIEFFLAYLAYIAPLRVAGLDFCLPEVSEVDKTTQVEGSFDLALAAKLVAEHRPVVCNRFHLANPERLLVVSGPNQGGKTTFARMFGQLHVLAALGAPVPGRSARLFLCDQVFTHFEREERLASLRGKLEDELVRLHASCQAMTGDSVIVLNEIFNSTGLEDQLFLSTKVLEQILATDALGVCVTFIDALSTLSAKAVSMVSTVVLEDPVRRTFEIARRPADGLAYALSLAALRGVTYSQLRARVGA